MPCCACTCRYGRNWLKLRVFNLTQYDAVLLVDSDLLVLGDLSHLFSLPVEFAAIWDQPTILGR
jgi:alpha-N-acetylglucosamine transferase